MYRNLCNANLCQKGVSNLGKKGRHSARDQLREIGRVEKAGVAAKYGCPIIVILILALLLVSLVFLLRSCSYGAGKVGEKMLGQYDSTRILSPSASTAAPVPSPEPPSKHKFLSL